MDRSTVAAGIIALRDGYEGSGGSTMGTALIMKDRIVEAREFTEYSSPDFMGIPPVPTPYSQLSNGE
jgi:hypothetical protein